MVAALILFFLTVILYAASTTSLAIVTAFGALALVLASQSERRKEKSSSGSGGWVTSKREIEELQKKIAADASTKKNESIYASKDEKTVSTTENIESIPVETKSIGKHEQTTLSKNDDYIQYIMLNNPTVTSDDTVSFVSVLDIYDNTKNKIKTLAAFDSFITKLSETDPMHAMMVNGYFCGLLGKNMSLTKEEIDSLAQKNTPMIIAKLNSQMNKEG